MEQIIINTINIRFVFFSLILSSYIMLFVFIPSIILLFHLLSKFMFQRIFPSLTPGVPKAYDGNNFTRPRIKYASPFKS